MLRTSDERQPLGGRPTAWTPALGSRLIDLVIDEGRSISSAAKALGVGRRTVYNWLALSARPDAPPSLAGWGRRFRSFLAYRRKDDRIYRQWLDRKRAKASWRAFKTQREAYHLEQLGPVEFWRRRVRWLEEHGRHAAADVAREKLAEAEAGGAGFRHDLTP